jgi:hypothetical protein
MKTLYTALALFVSATAADGQGIYMLNGRATPQVIVRGGGEVYPVIPNLCHGGPCPVLLAPHGRGLRSMPPSPIPGAPFERDPNDRGD